MKTVKTTPNQTIYDLAVKWYGTTEAVAEIAANNPGLKNDPAALAALGIDYINDNGFYFDAPLMPGSAVSIDTDSPLLLQSVVRELTGREINTFDTDTRNTNHE